MYRQIFSELASLETISLSFIPLYQHDSMNEENKRTLTHRCRRH